LKKLKERYEARGSIKLDENDLYEILQEIEKSDLYKNQPVYRTDDNIISQI
jgi:hypothetical protein